MLEELKCSVFNKYFWAAFLVMLSCFFGYSIPNWVFSAEWGMYREGALQLSIGGIFFGGSMLLLPFCASIPYAVSQVDEIRTGNLRYRAFYSSVRKYSVKKTVISMLSASLACGLAFFIHALFWNFASYPYDLEMYPYQEVPFAADCIYYEWARAKYAWPIYIWITFGIGYCAAIWSVTALAISVWITDKVLAIVVPVCIYYIWSCRITNHLFGIDLPHPATLYNDALTSTEVIQSIKAYSVLLLVSFIVYYIGLKKRCRNA